MRAKLPTLAAVALLALPAVAKAEEMLVRVQDGLMCRDEKSLADFTANDGTLKPSVMAVPFSATSKRFMTSCQGAAGPVQLVSRRTNTSVVTYRNQTWYVPNQDYMTPTSDCLKDGAHVTFTGTIGTGVHYDGENDTRGSRYPRLILDKPVCYLGNYADPAAKLMSLVPLDRVQTEFPRLMGMVGRHVTASGTINDPDNGHQPQDLMMMFDPVVRPAP